MDKAVLTCALTGVLTDPAVYPAPVSPEEMAREARRAFDEGASVVHVHFRRLDPRLGHLPSWDPKVATAVVSAIRDACPGIIVNQTTGVVGSDITGPLKCLAAVRPEIAALNAGSLNYLKTRADGSWAWPPILFDNSVDKICEFLDAMRAQTIEPEFECFDIGIVRTAAAIARNCGYNRPPKYNFVMGVELGMPATPTCCRPCCGSSRPTRAGASPRLAARKSGLCTAAPPNSAAICALGSRTRYTCPTVPAPPRTATSSRRWRRPPTKGDARSPRPRKRASRSALHRNRRRRSHDRP